VKGVDTNILIRYLTADDPEQSLTARTLLTQDAAESERFHVSAIVLCEVVWVLRTVYRYSRRQIVSALEYLMAVTVLEVQDLELVQRALADYRAGSADFADYLIGWQNQRAGCAETLTFDGALEGARGFTILR